MTKSKETKRQAVLTVAHHDFQKGLNSHAYFRLHDRTMSEDLVQDTFIKTWAYLVKGGKIEIMKAFLYHILNNLIVDEYRKRKSISLDVLLEKGFEPSAGDSEKPFSLLDGKSALLLIQRLPVSYQKVMRMRYVQDLSLQEMSLITGQSKNTIAVQIHRGLAKLKLLYSPL
jgi:RNA polymerase sigma-70 factor (ECF subfamily)